MNVMVKTKPFSLPPLPYDEGALEPIISRRTMGFHHGKHHAAYVKKLNELVTGTPLADQKLDDIVKSTYLDASKSKIYNNAAQAWNHAFFWPCIGPKVECRRPARAALERDLGGYAKFIKAFMSGRRRAFR
jgi:Fe-Mn family superoxide dismutase